MRLVHICNRFFMDRKTNRQIDRTLVISSSWTYDTETSTRRNYAGKLSVMEEQTQSYSQRIQQHCLQDEESRQKRRKLLHLIWSLGRFDVLWMTVEKSWKISEVSQASEIQALYLFFSFWISRSCSPINLTIDLDMGISQSCPMLLLTDWLTNLFSYWTTAWLTHWLTDR